MRNRSKQHGLSILGFLFVAAVIVACAMIGFRMAPAYIEYYSVQKALRQSLDETKDFQTPAELRKAFQRYADSGYIESVRGADVDVQKIGNEIVVSASWTRKLHLVSNVSLFLEFEASASR
jgi:hypothetical protein